MVYSFSIDLIMISINGSSIKYLPFPSRSFLVSVHSEAVLAVVNSGSLITKQAVVWQLKSIPVSFGEWKKPLSTVLPTVSMLVSAEIFF